MKKQKLTYILAEMAASHEGDAKIAKFIIEKSAQAKADGILFQLINPETYIVPSDKNYEKISSLCLDQKTWRHLIEKADFLGIDVWANVYDLESFEFSKDKGIRGFSLHSSNLENRDLVKEIIKSKKEILLSVGGMEEIEIEEILRFIYSIDKKARLYLIYGLQNFPTNPDGINLNFIKKLSERFKIPWGYQDHSEPTSSASTYMPILAISQGAAVIEKHITHNRSLKGIDYQAALNPDEFTNFVKDIRVVDDLLCRKLNEVSVDELRYKKYKSIMKVIAKQDIKIGEKFTKNNLTVMRAKKGEIAGRELKLLLNKKSKLSYKKFEPIKKYEKA